ncbi:MAG: 5'/3'-nucleotidase SurE [Gemmatimonadota bacterium]|jgi:5'-nucleotidase|nr:5'/3'-nucleotidase SurE [Gemmatimonadota bacterium]
MLILCTNDDGYFATGLGVLAEAARSAGEVRIVAPDREQSATSHSLTMHHPLRAHRVNDFTQRVDGTPTDCVALALGALLDQKPDVVLSGVNHGANMGEDVLYSGTVAGAMEATILGIPAIAFSYTGRDPEAIVKIRPLLERLITQLLSQPEFPPETLLNINIPPVETEVRGVRVTRLARRVYTGSLTRAHDPSGREYFWIGGGASEWKADEDSDFHAVKNGYISVTPLHLDLTNYKLLSGMREWGLTHE